MKVAIVQHDIVWEDAPATHAHVAPMINNAAADGARLIVLTEMFATGFSMHPERMAEDEGGPSEQFLLAQADKHGAYLIASIAQRSKTDGGNRNNAIVAAPDGTVRRYAKIHPFSYAGEHKKYTAGTESLTVEIENTRLSLFVCYDLRFADEFWALAPDTDGYVVVANWPAERSAHWRTLLPARAVENLAYVIGVNRVGTGKGVAYQGDSMIISPSGEMLAQCGPDEQVASAEVDAATVAATRKSLPFLADRRNNRR